MNAFLIDRVAPARVARGGVTELGGDDRAPGPESVVRHHLAPSLDSIVVGELTTAQVDRLYGELRRQGLSAGTVRRVHAVLHAALAQAQRWDWIWMNAAANANPPAHMPNEIQPPSAADVTLLIEKATASDPAFGGSCPAVWCNSTSAA